MLSPLSTLFLFSCSLLVYAGSQGKDQQCDPANNRLQTGTWQFYSDCNSVTYCAQNNTCVPKGCRKDDFPFGYLESKDFPDKCEKGQFCPDEMDACQDVLPVGSDCQKNRDDQCEGPPNFRELADESNRGLNFNGSVCLNNKCMWANETEGSKCVVDNTAYIGYGSNGEFIDIVSRGNCRIGLYCDSQTLECKASKVLGASCEADKECSSWNCLSSGICGPDSAEPRRLGTWVYVVVGLAIILGMLGTLFGLFFLHRRNRDHDREKRVQYWREQNAFHQNLLQMRETARASLLSLPGNFSTRSDGGNSDESHAPILQNAAPKASGLRYVDDASSEFDGASIMQHTQQRVDGRF